MINMRTVGIISRCEISEYKEETYRIEIMRWRRIDKGVVALTNNALKSIETGGIITSLVSILGNCASLCVFSKG